MGWERPFFFFEFLLLIVLDTSTTSKVLEFFAKILSEFINIILMLYLQRYELRESFTQFGRENIIIISAVKSRPICTANSLAVDTVSPFIWLP